MNETTIVGQCSLDRHGIHMLRSSGRLAQALGFMRSILRIHTAALLLSSFSAFAAGITADAETVTAAAKDDLGSRCNPSTPCTFKAARKDGQWLVVVGLTRRNSANEPARGYPGGQVFFTFDSDGNCCIAPMASDA